MGGKKHDGKRVTGDEARELFEQIRSQIGTNYSELAGSYRRGRPTCGDLDIVIVVGEGNTEFDAFCLGNFGTLKNGKIARTGLVDGVQVEFYIATPANWGTNLQMWTGSAFHNIKLRRLAKDKGYSMSQYGFKNTAGHLVTCTTETAVYDFLELPFVAPERR